MLKNEFNFFSKIKINKISKQVINTDNDNVNALEVENDISYEINNHSKKLIFFQMSNNLESIILYWYLLKNNHVLFLLSDTINNESIDNLIKLYNPNYLLLSKFNEKINFKFEFKKKIKNFFIFKNKKLIKNEIHKELCLMLSTSGSTGSSKLVKLSYENIYYNTKSISKFLNISNKDRVILTLPPFYTFGLSIINTHLMNGSQIYINNNSFFEKIFWEKINKFSITTFSGVTFMYEILKKIKFENVHTPSLKYITHAGGRISNDLHKYVNLACEKKKIKFFTMYGQTEATSRISYLDWKYSKFKIGSIGKSIPGGKIIISKKKNNYGEICYKGKNIMIGYANKVDDIKRKENIKILNTGDIGRKDKDGFFYILGRKDRFVKMFGIRINLDEIDKFLATKNYETVTIESNNKLKIFYKNKEYSSATIKEIISNFVNIQKQFVLPILIRSFPRSENKKIQYYKLKKCT